MGDFLSEKCQEFYLMTMMGFWVGVAGVELYHLSPCFFVFCGGVRCRGG